MEELRFLGIILLALLAPASLVWWMMRLPYHPPWEES